MANNIPRFLKYVFPTSSGTEIAQLQTATGPTNMILNGSYANPTGINSPVDIIGHGFSSTISLFSETDNSRTLFTINGYQNGVSVSEEIPGPSTGTATSYIGASVETTKIFDKITSITSSERFIDISVGIGNTAFFNLIKMDANALIPVYSIEIYWVGEATGHGYVTIDDITDNGFDYQQLVNEMPNGPLFELSPYGGPLGDFTSPQFISQLGYLQHFLFKVIRTTNNDIILVFRGSS